MVVFHWLTAVCPCVHPRILPVPARAGVSVLAILPTFVRVYKLVQMFLVPASHATIRRVH